MLKLSLPVHFRIASEGHRPAFKNFLKLSPLLLDFDVHRTRLHEIALATRTNSMRFVCNGALRLHTAPGTHVKNIHKMFHNRRAFLSFQRLITTGTPHDRRVLHSILHIPAPRSRCLSRQIDFLSASLSWHAGVFDFRKQSAASLLLGHEELMVGRTRPYQALAPPRALCERVLFFDF